MKNIRLVSTLLEQGKGPQTPAPRPAPPPRLPSAMAPITKLPNSTKPKLKGDTHSRSAELLVQAHPSMRKCYPLMERPHPIADRRDIKSFPINRYPLKWVRFCRAPTYGTYAT